MKPISPESAGLPRYSRIAILLISLVGYSFIALATSRYGAGLSPDSVTYIAAARQIQAGQGAVALGGAPLVEQPPLYPAVLTAAASIFGADPALIASSVNAVLFGLAIYLTGWLAYRYFTSPPLAILSAAIALFSVPLFLVSVMAWSEPLFICLALLYLIFQQGHDQKHKSLDGTLASLAAALACLTRYIGVVLILTGALRLLMAANGHISARLKRAAGFALLAAAPLCLWLLRNYNASGSLFGERAPSAVSLAENAYLTLTTIASWYFLGMESFQLTAFVLFNLLLLVLIAAGRQRLRQVIQAVVSPLAASAQFIALYTGFLIASATLTAHDPIDTRLLAPIFIPACLLLLSALRQILSPALKTLSPKKKKLLLLFTALLWSLYSLWNSVLLVAYPMSHGLGYNSVAWRDSATIRYLLESSSPLPACDLYANDPYALYIRAEVEAQQSPARTPYRSNQVITELASLAGSFPQADTACLVWFTGVERDYLFTPAELQTIARLEPVIQLEDGIIYLVQRK